MRPEHSKLRNPHRPRPADPIASDGLSAPLHGDTGRQQDQGERDGEDREGAQSAGGKGHGEAPGFAAEASGATAPSESVGLPRAALVGLRAEIESQSAAFARETFPETNDADPIEDARAAHVAAHRALTDLNAQFAERKAEALRVQHACFKKGYAGKDLWFKYKADFEAWRARASRYKIALEARVVGAKAALRGAKAARQPAIDARYHETHQRRRVTLATYDRERLELYIALVEVRKGDVERRVQATVTLDIDAAGRVLAVTVPAVSEEEAQALLLATDPEEAARAQ